VASGTRVQRADVNDLRKAVAGTVAAPFLVGALAVGVFAVWAAKGAGYDVTTWSPGALFLLGLLAVAGFAYAAVRPKVAPATAVAASCLLAFAVWSAISIIWSDARGVAWEAANRALLYAIVYALFAFVPWRRAHVVVLPCVFSLAVAAVGVVDLARAAYGGDPSHFFSFGRFSAPAGYPNAACALFVLAVWPVAYLAARREAPPLVRGVSLALAGTLAELALLTESRASLVAVPLALIVFVAIVPYRLRAFAVVAAIGLTLGAAHTWLLAPYEPLNRGLVASGQLHRVVLVLAISAAVLAVAWTIVGMLDNRVDVPARVGRAIGAILIVVIVAAALVAAVWFATSSPERRIQHAWRDFKSGYSAKLTSSHFSSGVGNNRYDFWRVALHEVRRHPLAGVGAGNFAEDYLVERRSPEEPLYPHSLELGVLEQTGAVGGALFAGFVIAGLVATGTTFRRRDLAAGMARAGLAASAYWAIHGSIDWFWEFPGLTAPALAWLGIAAAGAAPSAAVAGSRASLLRRAALAGPALLAAFVVAISFVLPWLASSLENRAAATWRRSPSVAFRDLDRAARIDPLSPDPKLLEGAIASRLNQTGRMRRAFLAALQRDPRIWYAQFELALADAASGRKISALTHLGDAARLDPREPAIGLVRAKIRAGEAIDRRKIDLIFIRRVRTRVGP
jgi:hypothetical protein